MKIRSFEEAVVFAFEEAYRGLRGRFWRRAILSTGECQYQVREPDCRRCAIGWLISDRLYEPLLEGRTPLSLLKSGLLVGPIQEWFDIASDFERNDFYGFLMSLQSAHDGGSNPDKMFSDFEKIRRSYGWEVPSEV